MAERTQQEELDELDRVLTRLALTEEANLEKVVKKLLPLAVDRLSTPHKAVQVKVLGMLSHINKRVKGQKDIKLPLEALLGLFCRRPPPLPMVRNFALVYVEMAAQRATPDQRLAIVPHLLEGIASKPAAQRDMLLRLAAGGLAQLNGPGAPRQGDDADEAAFAAKYTFLQSDADRAVFLEYGRILLLYSPAQKRLVLPLAPDASQEAAARAVDPVEITVLPGGLAASDLARIEGTAGAPRGEELTLQRLGFLNFITAAGVVPKDALVPYLLAACDAQDPQGRVAARGETLVRKRCGVDSSKPVVDLEDTTLLESLFRLFLGSHPEGTTPSSAPATAATTASEGQPGAAAGTAAGQSAGGAASTAGATVTEPAGQALQLRLLSLFTRSLAAANAFPRSVQVIFACVYGKQKTLRLQQAGMEFAVWTFKHASPERLAPVAPSVLAGLLTLLDEEIPGDNAGRTLRSFTYQALGQLAARQPQLFARDTSAAARFFQALVTEPPGVRASVQEAVGSLAAAYRGCTGTAAEEIESLLLTSIAAPEEGRRLAAVQWALRLFPFRHVAARYVCCTAAGDRKLEVREAGLGGLKPPKATGGATSTGRSGAARAAPDSAGRASEGATSAGAAEPKEAVTGSAAVTDMVTDGAAAQDAAYPSAREVVAYFRKRHPRLGAPADAGEQLLMSEGAFLALLKFIQAAKASTKGSGDSSGDDEQDLVTYAGVFEHALVRDATPALQVAALEALLGTAAGAPLAFSRLYAPRMLWLRSFLGHTDAAAREAAAKLCGVAAAGQSGADAADLLQQLAAVFLAAGSTTRHGAGGAPSAGGAAPAASDNRAAAVGRAAARFEERDGTAAACGYVLAQAMSGSPSIAQEALTAAAEALHAALADSDATLAAAAAAALGHAALRGQLPLPEGQLPASSPANPDAFALGTATASVIAVVPPATAPTTRAAPLADTPVAMDTDAAPTPATRSSVLQRVVGLTGNRDNKVVLRAVATLGHLASHQTDAATLQAASDGLLALSSNKNEEVQFAVGEALCFVFGGVPVTADTILHSGYRGLAAHLTATGEAANASAVPPEVEGSGPTDMAIDGEAPADGVEGSASKDPPARTAAQDQIMTKLLNELIFHSRTEVRCGACIALLSLASFTGRHPALQPRLPAIQEAFSGLLGDSNEVTQEMASRGISVVYAMSGSAARKQLLDELVGVLQGGARKRRAVKVEGDTRVFAEGSMPTAPGGGTISTYKELQGLANDLGQPDLVYRFMDLANHAASLNSSRGAAFGFAGIAKLAGEQLAPYVAAMVPKLYRYQYDPNLRVRDAMAAIWRALVPEPREAIEKQWGAIADELLKEVGGRLWRNREAACLGLADLLQGRRWPAVADKFEAMWTMALRALDDIKESVRASAVTLARALRSLTLRVTDREHSAPADAAAAVGISLPLLLDKGMGSTVGEVAALAVDTIAQIVKGAGAGPVRPHLQLLVGSLLESLSTLEDTRLNYLEQHAERLGVDSGRLESARFSAAKASPMGDALDAAARYVDGPSLEALVPKLGSIAKRGVGVNTRVGAAKFVAALALRMGPAIRPSSGALIKAFVAAARTERSSTAQKAFAAAVASVARYATEARVEKLCQEVVALYAEPGDRPARFVAALLARELARGASEAFAKHAATVLPLAFLAQSDEEKDVAGLWGEVWEEGTTGGAAALRLYAADIVPLLTAGLSSQQWGRKRAAADAAAAAAEASPDALAPYSCTVATALQAELPGRLWDGKEAVLASLAAVAEACPDALGSQGAAAAVAALVEAAGRKKAAFRTAALAALARTLKAFPRQDHFAAASPPLLLGLAAHAARQAFGAASASPSVTTASAPAAAATSADDGPGVGDGSTDAPPPVAETVRALGAAWAGAGPDTVEARGGEAANALAAALLPGHPWSARVEALGVARDFILKARDAPADGQQHPQLPPQHLPWVCRLVPGLLAGTEEAKVSAVRSAALSALKALLEAAGGGGALPALERAAVQGRLTALGSSERSIAISAQAAALLASMPAAMEGVE